MKENQNQSFLELTNNQGNREVNTATLKAKQSRFPSIRFRKLGVYAAESDVVSMKGHWWVLLNINLIKFTIINYRKH